MNAAQILSSLESSGFSMKATDGRVIVRPSSRLNDNHRQLIRGHKAELLELLNRPPPLIDHDHETQSLDALSAIWRIRTPIYDIDVVYHEPVSLDRVKADYPDFERIRARGKHD